MKRAFRIAAVGLLCLLLSAGLRAGSEPNDTLTTNPSAKAVIIVCKGDIDDGLYRSIRRRTRIALDDGAEYLIYEIGTYGGLLKSADDISKYLILDIGKLAHTVAYVTTEAISAGSMISVSCQDIIMRENTTIGDCAPIVMGGKLEGVEREKIESFTRAAFMRAAEANGYPKALLKAMVTMQTKVYKVKNLKTGKNEFFEGQQLPEDPNQYDLDNKELIVDEDELLTLTASQAAEYGIARTVVDNQSEALDFLAKRDSVTFVAKPKVLKTLWSEEMVRWLNSPAVMAVLVMLGLLGLYIEFNTPGLGLPGLIAVTCFVIIVGSKYLSGLANWVEVLLFVVGVLLLFVEIFILPGFGIAGVLGIVCMIAGLLGMLFENLPNKSPWPWPQDAVAWSDFTSGIMALCLGVIGSVVFAWIISKYLPKTQIPFLSGLFLVPANRGKGGVKTISMTAPHDSKIRSVEVGDTGRVVTTLRPIGTAQFGDAIVNVVAESEFLDKGTKVEIMNIYGNRVVVRAVKDE
jgi:membrane-bound serine protease (ClpP class)